GGFRSWGDPGDSTGARNTNTPILIAVRTMAETAVEFREDRVPSAGMAEAVDEMVDLYGGEIRTSGEQLRRFVLPLRRGVAVAGGVECTLSWTVGEADQATLTMQCNRDVDAPKAQRIALLVVGVIGAL